MASFPIRTQTILANPVHSPSITTGKMVQEALLAGKGSACRPANSICGVFRSTYLQWSCYQEQTNKSWPNVFQRACRWLSVISKVWLTSFSKCALWSRKKPKLHGTENFLFFLKLASLKKNTWKVLLSHLKSGEENSASLYKVGLN